MPSKKDCPILANQSYDFCYGYHLAMHEALAKGLEIISDAEINHAALPTTLFGGATKAHSVEMGRLKAVRELSKYMFVRAQEAYANRLNEEAEAPAGSNLL
jgi:hypothetical protein